MWLNACPKRGEPLSTRDFCLDHTLTNSLDTMTPQVLGYVDPQADHVYVVSVPISELALCKKFIVSELGKGGTAFLAMDHLRVGCQEFPILFLCVWLFFTCISVHCLCPWYPQGQETISDLLGLELQAVVSCCVGAGNQNWACRKMSRCPELLSHLSSDTGDC